MSADEGTEYTPFVGAALECAERIDNALHGGRDYHHVTVMGAGAGHPKTVLVDTAADGVHGSVIAVVLRAADDLLDGYVGRDDEPAKLSYNIKAVSGPAGPMARVVLICDSYDAMDDEFSGAVIYGRVLKEDREKAIAAGYKPFFD